MSRVGTGLFLALLVAVSVLSFILHVNADEPALEQPVYSRRAEPSCLSTVEVLSDVGVIPLEAIPEEVYRRIGHRKPSLPVVQPAPPAPESPQGQ